MRVCEASEGKKGRWPAGEKELKPLRSHSKTRNFSAAEGGKEVKGLKKGSEKALQGTIARKKKGERIARSALSRDIV